MNFILCDEIVKRRGGKPRSYHTQMHDPIYTKIGKTGK
jgi:hypothetical protein